MFLKISDKDCISTKGLRSISLTEKNDFIQIKFKDEERSIPLTQPLYTGVDSDYIEFANLVYTHCYMAIITAELTAKHNINTSFDLILNNENILLNREAYEKEYARIRSSVNLTDKKEIWNLMLPNLISIALNEARHYI